MARPTLLLAAALLGPALAHDFWLEPASFHPAQDRPLGLVIKVGDDFEGEALPRDPDLIERFVTLGPADEEPRDVIGLDGRSPAGYLRPRAEGLHWVALTTPPRAVELPQVHFDRYLIEEGLERILRERARRGEARATGRERYSRCAKTALLVGDGRGRGWDGALGLPLELVLDGDPALRDPEQGLGVRLLFDGEPVRGALVTAVRRGAAGEVLSARSDEHGRVRLALDDAGAWLISAVHMVRDTECEDSDWRSWWASLTFELPG